MGRHKVYLPIIALFIMGISIFAFSQDTKKAEIYYLKGENKLTKGFDNLVEFKKHINQGFGNYRAKLEDIRSQFEDDKITLSSFLEVFKRYEPKSPYSENLCREKINSFFDGAIRDFDEAISLDNTFVDAYIGKAMALVEIGDYRNALNIFNMALSLIIEKNANIKFIRPFGKTTEDRITENLMTEDLFYGITDEIMKNRLDPPQGEDQNEYSEGVIEVLKNWRENWLDKNIKDLKNQIAQEKNLEKKERLKEKMEELITKKVHNFFAVPNFYIRYHQKNEAENKYKEVVERVKKEGMVLGEYPGLINEIEGGYKNLKEASFMIDSSDLDKEFKNPVKIKFFRNDYFSCNYLYLSFLSSGCWVEFKDEVSCEVMGSKEEIFLKEQKSYACEIAFPAIAIKVENKLPFYILADNGVPVHWTEDNEKLSGPTSFKMLFEDGSSRKYPEWKENYKLERDENNEWTVVHTIKEGKTTRENFRKTMKFTSKITISPFAGKEIKICKAVWPVSKEKNRIKLSPLFVFILFGIGLW